MFAKSRVVGSFRMDSLVKFVPTVVAFRSTVLVASVTSTVAVATGFMVRSTEEVRSRPIWSWDFAVLRPSLVAVMTHGPGGSRPNR